jgi:hypothetical protein
MRVGPLELLFFSAIACSQAAAPSPPEGGAGEGPASASGGVPGTSGTPGIRLDPGGSMQGGGPGCPNVDVSLRRTVPTIAVLVDRSSSMTLPLENGVETSRWDALKAALLDPTDGVITMLEQQVRFGLALYGNAPPYFPECPDLVEIMPPALNNYAAIQAVYGPAGTIPNTPTGDAFAIVASNLSAFTEPGPKYVILATDGDPDRCDANAGQDLQDDASKQLSVRAVQSAFNQGIGTFVIGVGRETVSVAHLAALANVGAGLAADSQPGARYYETGSRSELQKALAKITGGVTSCTFDLDGEVVARQAGRGAVELDGDDLPMSETDGWRLVNPSQVELVGTACEKLKVGDHRVEASFPCDVVVR